MTTLFFILLFQTEGFYKIHLDGPVKYQHEHKSETFVTGIRQFESNGKHLFLLRQRNPSVIQITAEGEFIRNIGRRGDGPGELGYHGPTSMAVQGESVWIYRADRKKKPVMDLSSIALHRFQNFQR